MDADVQEAADDRAERAGEHEPEQRRQRVGHERGCPAAAGSSGGGQSDDDFDSCTRPSISSKGVPVGSTGMPAQHAPADERPPVRLRAGAPRVVVERALQRVNHVERLQLDQAALRILAQPVRFRRLQNRGPHRARRSAISALSQGRGRQRSKPPGRARDVGRFLEPLGGGEKVVTKPVVDEPDVLQVLPLVGPLAQSLFQQRNRQIGTVRPARIRLGQEDGPESVGDVEPRIERRRDVQQRIQQREGVRGERCRRFRHDRLTRARRVDLLPRAAIVLNGADPVDVGEQRVVGPGQPAHGGGRTESQRILGHVDRRVGALARRLQLDGGRQQHDGQRHGRDNGGRRSAGHGYLKSRREKTSEAIASSIAM